MPFAMLGKHAPFTGAIVKSLDYITLELYNLATGDAMYVWLSSALHSWQIVSASDGSLYDKQTAPSPTTPATLALVSGTSTAVGPTNGAPTVLYTQTVAIGSTYPAISVTVTMGTCSLSFTMVAQGNYNSTLARNQMHLLTVAPSTCFKCYTCGLFGSFRRGSQVTVPSGLDRLVTCNGGWVYYKGGWDPSNLYAFDLNGWTWAKSYVDANCDHWPVPIPRRRSLSSYQPYDSPGEYSVDLPAEFVNAYVDPCAGASVNDTLFCDWEYTNPNITECCTNIIGGRFCSKLMNWCYLDICLFVNDVDVGVEELVVQILTNPIVTKCASPTANAEEDALNAVEAPGAPEWPVIENMTDSSENGTDSSENVTDGGLIYHLSYIFLAFHSILYLSLASIL
jgi:hypothetical protein